MLIFGVLPVVAALLPLYLYLWGWQMAIAHTAISVTQSLILIEVLLLRFDKIPFTCSYAPGKSNMTKMCGVYVWAFAFYAHNMAFLVFLSIRRPAAFAFLYACLAGVLIQVVRRRRKELSESPGVQFEDAGCPVVTVLDITRVPSI